MVSDSQIREARRKALSGLEGLLEIVGFKVTTEGTIIRSRHNQQQCRPGGGVCLPQTPKRQEVRAKTRVSPPGLHPSLGGWPEATVCQRRQSLGCTGWPI